MILLQNNKLAIKAAERIRCGLYFIVLITVTGCSTTPQSDQLLRPEKLSAYPPSELTSVPFYPQEKYQCGPASLAMILNNSGIAVEPRQLTPLVYIPGKKGSLQLELVAATRRYERIPYVIKPRLDHLLDEVRAGKPVLVFQNLGLGWYPVWHYAVVVGYNLGKNELVLRSGLQERHVMSLNLFERTWERADYWGLVVLSPGELPIHADKNTYLSALLGLERLKKWPALINAYQSGVAKWPESVEMQMGLANSYYAQQQFHPAVAQYKKILQQYPEYAPAHNNLAQTYMDLNRLDAALLHAKQAVKLGGVHQNIFQETLKEILQLLDKREMKPEKDTKG